MNGRLNKHKYPGAKRLMLEAQEMKDSTEDYCAQPIDDNLFEWHFTVRGPPDTAFEGGYYHGRLSFPTDYPMKPPSIILLTPNGRFETNKKICLSISGYHPETWQPSWSVRTALVALMAFMPTKANRAIGSLDFSDVERKRLALKSQTWTCETCGLVKNLLRHPEIEINSNLDECVAGSSTRVTKTSDTDEIERRRNNSTSDRSDSDADSEDRDSLTNSQGSTSSNSSSQINKPTPKQLIDSDSRKQDGQQTCHISNIDLNSSDQPLQRNGRSTKHIELNDITQEVRRSYSSFVFRSIFFLLFLLILRRVIMLVQVI